MNPISSQLANKGLTKRSPLGLGSGECGQHPCPPENRRACRKGPVQHEFDLDISGDSRVLKERVVSDETRLCVLAT
ncbi:hypothetical protein TNCV_1987671 [Trichonephila clavipes]|nr:hypothetical protein TNCV_1987671 [Trichonephila clavipes]